MPSAPPSPLEQRRRCLMGIDTACLPEIRRQLLRFRYDPEFRGNGKRVPIRQLAALCQVSRQLLYALMRDPNRDNALVGLQPGTRDRILTAIDLVVRHGLRWKRTGTSAVAWTAAMPDGSPPPIIPRRAVQRANNDRPHL